MPRFKGNGISHRAPAVQRRDRSSEDRTLCMICGLDGETSLPFPDLRYPPSQTMKTTLPTPRIPVLISGLCLGLAALLITGCSSTSNGGGGTAATTFGTTADGTRQFRSTDHFEKVWLADGFDFNGYDILLVTDLDATGIEPKDEKEADRLDLLKRVYPTDMAASIGRHRVFPKATGSAGDLVEGKKVLVLDTKLLDYSRGSSAARFGLGFGAGMPYIKITGTFHEQGSDEPRAILEMDEKGDWFGSGYASTESLQNAATMEIGKDLAEYISKVSRHDSIKYGKAK